jgi:6-pyruvoyltetrahydropterin/6-carboxytetrahydropterin synthase
MYEVTVEQEFDAAHYLRGYEGKCEKLHGHRFRVVASVTAQHTDEVGMAYDFTRLKKHLAEILGRLDHTCLNEVPPFDGINPSSENLATVIYQELAPVLKGTRARVSKVQVWESPHSRVTYFPEEFQI